MSDTLSLNEIIAKEINARPAQVEAAVRLVDEGATIPFIARYRKEMTGGLDDGQLRLLDERLVYLRELNVRRQSILESIQSQEKLTPELEQSIRAAATKAELEDLYLPYRPKRRTRAQIAREKGLGFLADMIVNDRRQDPEELATAYLGGDVPDVVTALEGVRDILTEEMGENAVLIGRLRDFMCRNAYIRAKVLEGKEKTGIKFSNYFDYEEKWADIPSHRALAVFRGRNEDILSLSIEPKASSSEEKEDPIYQIIADIYAIGDTLPGDLFLSRVAMWAWRVKLSLHLSLDLMRELRERADKEAIRIFALNLKDLLLAAPAGSRKTLGLDPGIRTGVKAAVVDGTGKVLETATLYPFSPKDDIIGTEETLIHLIKRHGVDLIAIGNGTAGRETEKIVTDVLAKLPTPRPVKIIVSEAGASVYSASALAAEELPELDVTLRGAVSIARRLQDPLAELVKIPPRSIGVGQYQHDVDQQQLGRALNGVVEDAVNAVGVDVNTASPALLSYISGLNSGLVEAIVSYRNVNGPFKKREELKSVPRMGERSFEQSAGFLRILGGEEPLDASSVHPEAYAVARKMIEQTGLGVKELMGDKKAIAKIKLDDFIDDHFGLLTLNDIVSELEKPGRDPRPEFKTANFSEGINNIADLKPGMELEGVVTNITGFGVFVDIGVHEDGLVHVSEVADTFVTDPHEHVSTGMVVKVHVLDVDLEQKRISLSMRKQKPAETEKQKTTKAEKKPAAPTTKTAAEKKPKTAAKTVKKAASKKVQGGLGDVLSKALEKKAATEMKSRKESKSRKTKKDAQE